MITFSQFLISLSILSNAGDDPEQKPELPYANPARPETVFSQM